MKVQDGFSGDSFTSSFTLNVVLSNNPPEWLRSFPTLNLYLGDNFKYYLPSYVDQDPFPILTLNFNL